jgi:hypothetical protein
LSSSEQLTTGRDCGRASLHAALLSCGWRASRRLPNALAPYGLSAPATWFDAPTSRCSDTGQRGPELACRLPPAGLHPASEYCPAAVHRRARSQRFFAPTAQPSRQEPPLPGLRTTRVMLRPHAYHAPRRLAPLTASLVYFQPGALTGFAPSELDLARVVDTSRRRPPFRDEPCRTDDLQEAR